MKVRGKGNKGKGDFQNGQDSAEDIVIEKPKSIQKGNMKERALQVKAPSHLDNGDSIISKVTVPDEVDFNESEEDEDTIIDGSEDETIDGTPLELLEELDQLNIYGDDVDDLDYDYPESENEY